MNILHINTGKSWRGAEQQIWYLLQADTPVIHNFLFCPRGSELHQRSLGLGKITGTYTKRFGLDLAGAWTLRSFLRAQHISLVHIHDSHGLNLWWAARLMGSDVPAVLTRHVDFRPGNPYKYRSKQILRIICVSQAVKVTMSEFTDPEKLVVIHPGISVTGAERSGTLREMFGIGTDTILVGTVCALEKEKDLPLFIRIVQGLMERDPGVHAVIIGDGSLRPALEEQVGLAGLTGHIHFTGFRKDVEQLLPDLDIFLFTSLSEGFGLAPAEAMLAGVPVVARYCSGTDELINGDRSGRTFRSEAEAIEQLNELIGNPAYRETLAREGREQALRFSLAQMTEKTHTLYTEILR